MDSREIKQDSLVLSTSNSSSAASVLAAATSVAMLGVSMAKKEFKKYQKAKQLESVKHILDIYQRHLVNITVSGLPEHPTLPPPFILDDQNNPKSAKALILNDAMKKDLLMDKTVTNDAFLLKYSRHIQTAKQYILNFYEARLSSSGRSVWTRGKGDDVTSSVMTYLLVMLSQYCTKFEGYEMDMAILGGMIRFINGFVSVPRKNMFGKIQDPKKRQRFEMLKKSCKELRKAKRVLRDHSNLRKLKYYVDELMSVCNKDLVPGLIKIFAKLQAPEDHWQAIDAAPLSVLAEGKVQEEFKSTSSISWKKSDDGLPDSIFKEWLQNLVAYSLDPEYTTKDPIELTDADFEQIKTFFLGCKNILTLKSPQPGADGEIFTDGFVTVGFDKDCYVTVVSKIPSPPALVPHSFLVVRPEFGQEASQVKVYEVSENRQPLEVKIAEVNGLEKTLARLPADKLSERFTQKDLKALNRVLTKYRNESQIKARARIFEHLALLLDQLIDLDQFCQKLSDCIRELGEIYMKNPHHCSFVFESLMTLGREINDRIGTLLKALEKIEDDQDNANDLLLELQSNLALLLQNKLYQIQRKVIANIQGITNRHQIHNAQIGDPKAKGTIDYDSYETSRKKKEIQGMLLHATAVAMKYKMDTNKYQLEPVISVLRRLTPSTQCRRLQTRRSTPPSPVRDVGTRFSFQHWSVGSILLTEAKEDKYEFNVLQDQSRYLVGTQNKSRRSSYVGCGENKAEELEDNPEALLNLIRQRLKVIYNEDRLDSKTNGAYERLYQTLNGMRLKVQKMEKERDPPGRIAKATDVKNLTVHFCHKTLRFLSLDKKQRAEAALSFSTDVRDELVMMRNSFLDEHKSIFYHFLRALKELVLCLVGYGFYVAYHRGGFFKTDSRAAAHQVESSSLELKKKLTLASPPSRKRDSAAN